MLEAPQASDWQHLLWSVAVHALTWCRASVAHRSRSITNNKGKRNFLISSPLSFIVCNRDCSAITRRSICANSDCRRCRWIAADDGGQGMPGYCSFTGEYTCTLLFYKQLGSDWGLSYLSWLLNLRPQSCLRWLGTRYYFLWKFIILYLSKEYMYKNKMQK